MNYEEIRRRILYSKQMGRLSRIESPVPGYMNAAEYAGLLEHTAAVVALKSEMDKGYCSTLALATVLATPPYGPEGEKAVKTLMGDRFNQSKISIEYLEDIIGQPIEERLKKDIKDIYQYKETLTDEDLSNEAKCVAYIGEALRDYELLSPQEQEELGSKYLRNSMILRIKRNDKGVIGRSVMHEKVRKLVRGRSIRTSEEKVAAASRKMQKRLVDTVMEEKEINSKILEV